MSAVKAYEVKSLMSSIDEDYDTAICYIRKAMQEVILYGLFLKLKVSLECSLI